MASPACPLVFTTQNTNHSATTTVSRRHCRPRKLRQFPRQCPSRIISMFALVVVIATTMLPGATASALPEPTPPAPRIDNILRSHVDRHAINMAARAEHEELEKYELEALRKRDATSTLAVILSTDGGSTTAATTTTVVTSPLPSPFDGSLAANFHGNGACPKFINSFLTNSTFKACYPFSLLVQGSQGFFEAEKSAVAVTQILQVSCNASVSVCAPYLSDLANQLLKPENCKDNYQLGNQVVEQAYYGMIAYKELYAVSCLKDPNQGGYCFTNAVTNYTTPSNAYLYLLPLNLSLPDSATPSCDWCVKNTMDIYQSAAADRTLPIADLYVDAAKQVNDVCGADFVNETLPAATVENSAGKALFATTLATATTIVLTVLSQLMV